MRDTLRADVTVVGAGPAGLAAAIHAAEGGARVVVIDQAARPGGQIWRHRARGSLPVGAQRLLARFDRSGARLLSAATVADVAPGTLDLSLPSGQVRVTTRATVLATGARELFLPFPGWTLPNVVGVGGLQALIKSGLDVRGRRVVIAGTGPLLYPVAAAAARAGAHVVLVAEQAPSARVLGFGASLLASPGKLVAAARYRRAFRHARVRRGVWVERAEGADAVERVTVSDGRHTEALACDLLATAAGLIPNLELATLLGCRLRDGAIDVDARQATSVPTVYAAGECTGVGGEDAALVEGAIAGTAAVGGDPTPWYARRDRLRRFASRMGVAFAPRSELLARLDADTVICRCEDVRRRDLHADWGARQGKLATRAGMGACQGRVCGPAMQCLWGWDAPVVRPPLTPVPVAALADAPPRG